ncbi:gp16 family protein [Grimontia hollisae]|uniref:Mu-like prophage protein gp16 n=1 Tax=Grimontia hollisae TaxID=673 RepID=A0A377HPI7_GRIHO|nr:regulatory protein GemA [Grimontia hollisae]STO57602.1 Mu-like prophage protein gp16 [Grimontia hollisae]
MEQRTRLIKLIHIGKRELGLDDETYRALLQRETGKDSCKSMLNNELDTVLRVMERKGFKRKVTQSKKRLSPKTQGKPDVTSKVRALWITMAKEGIIRDGSEASLDAYVRRMTKQQNGSGVDYVAWCTTEQAHHILESLKKWRIRLAKTRQ